MAEEHHERSIRCRLMINLRDDDTGSLIKIKEQFGGRIHPSSSHSSYFIVSDREGCLKLVRHFDRYPLQSKKRYDYLIWKKIVLMVSRYEHMNGKRDEVLHLVRLLREVREYRVGREKVFEKLLMGQ